MAESQRKRSELDTEALEAFLKQVSSFTEDLIFVPPGDGLFHYTDLSGLHGIVSNSDIWLTNSRYSNDGEELTLGYKVADGVIDGELESLGGTPSDRATYLKALKTLLKTAPPEGVYICCFCLSGNLLSQWRGYGGNGCGVSIRFAPQGFASVTGPDSPKFGLLRLWKVFYDSTVQESIVREALNFGLGRSSILDEQVRYAAEAITFFIPTFKNNDFKEEHECRLIFTPWPSMKAKQRFRVARGMLVPYFSLRELTGSPIRLPIERVLVGPMPHRDLNIQSVEALLGASEYNDVVVAGSTTPYRA